MEGEEVTSVSDRNLLYKVPDGVDGNTSTVIFVVEVVYSDVEIRIRLETNAIYSGGTGGCRGVPWVPRNPPFAWSLPARREIIVRMRASYSRAHSRVCATNQPFTASAVCS